MFAAADARTSYSHVYGTTGIDGDTPVRMSTTATCNVRGCGWSHRDLSKTRAERKAAEHRREHRTCLSGGEQATVFDAIEAAS